MRQSPFPSDDDLPTWLHALILLVLVAPCAGFLVRFGMSARFTARLEPLSGPEAGQFLFGPEPLQGSAARMAGRSLLVPGAGFLAIAWRFSRLCSDGLLGHLLPWSLLALSVMLSFRARALASHA